MKQIEYNAFKGCENLRHVQLPNGLEKIGVDGFNSSGLEEIVFPPNVKIVCPRAFYGCAQLRSAQLNDGLEILGAKE